MLDDPTDYRAVRWHTPHMARIAKDVRRYRRATYPLDFYRWRTVLRVDQPTSADQGWYTAQIRVGASHDAAPRTTTVRRLLAGPFYDIALSVRASVLLIGQQAHASCTVARAASPVSILWQWSECAAPVGDGAQQWMEPARCARTSNWTALTTSVARTAPQQSHVSWWPQGPGIIECSTGGMMRSNAGFVYVLEIAMPATAADARLASRVATSLGDRHQFVCLIDRYNHSADSVLEWQLDGRAVQGTADGRVRIDGTRTVAYAQMVLLLHIDGVAERDLGLYECVVDRDEVVRRIALSDGDRLAKMIVVGGLALVLLVGVALLSYMRGVSGGLCVGYLSWSTSGRSWGVAHFLRNSDFR